MSDNIEKSKKADAVEEEVPLQATEDVLLEEPVKTKSSEKAKAKSEDKEKAKKSTEEIMKGMPKGEIHWRTIDPIIKVSFVVFILACAVVIGNFFVEEYLADHSGPQVTYDDTVMVDYVGSYNTYYDDSANNPVVFDTSLADVGNDSKYTKSWSFSKTEYSQLKVNISGTSSSDNGNYLTLFKQAMIGHKVGETVTVKIAPADGYGELTDAQQGISSKTGVKLNVAYITDSTSFTDFFGSSAPTAGSGMVKYTSPYGWDAMVVTDSEGIKVQYMPAVDQTYKINDKVSVKVTAIAEGVITYDYIFTYEGMMLKAAYNNQIIYITGVNDTGTDFSYKTSGESIGEYLYFTIFIRSIVTESS